MRIHVPFDETKKQKILRLFREDTQAWHQNFWSRHNINFKKVNKQLISIQIIKLLVYEK